MLKQNICQRASLLPDKLTLHSLLLFFFYLQFSQPPAFCFTLTSFNIMPRKWLNSYPTLREGFRDLAASQLALSARCKYFLSICKITTASPSIFGHVLHRNTNCHISVMKESADNSSSSYASASLR